MSRRLTQMDVENCARKRHHKSRREAEEVKKRMREHWHEAFTIYRCACCRQGWLIGSIEDFDAASYVRGELS